LIIADPDAGALGRARMPHALRDEPGEAPWAAIVMESCLDESAIRDVAIGFAGGEEVDRHLRSCSLCAARVSSRRRGLEPTGTPTLERGTAVGRYLVVGLVGRGAMGDVYAAYDPELDRKVALKLLRDGRDRNEERALRLQREAKAIARLSHENVVAVYDAGAIGDQAYVAMEFVDGKNVAEWIQSAASPPSWRQILRVFIAAGRGLAAAHQAGLVHRDFKPHNVMVRGDGVVRVTDFGMARLTDAATAAPERGPGAAGELPPDGQPMNEALTETGALMGTPAYMAPEQMEGGQVDSRSDQFGYCVSLYEALYGQRPFAGDHLSTLWLSVTSGAVRPPATREIPPWVRRVLLRGLSVKPEDRFPSMGALVAQLERDPAARRRRLLVAGAGLTLVVASVVTAQQSVQGRRAELDRTIAAHLGEARAAADQARAQAGEARARARRAFAAFDAMDRDSGEDHWSAALALLPAIEASYDRAGRAFEAALVLDSSRVPVEDELARAIEDELGLAREFRRKDRIPSLLYRLERHDRDGSRRRVLERPGSVVVTVRPPGARQILERFESEPSTGRRTPQVVPGFDPARSTGALSAGSYRLTARADGHAEVSYPFEVRPGERAVVHLTLPRAAAVPPGFVYVPAGEFWFGEADDDLRTQFLDTVPMHRRRAHAFLIARHETTYQEWIAFLDELPAAAREQHAPGAAMTEVRGSVKLEPVAGTWRLTFQGRSQRYSALATQPIQYAGRSVRARQDWLRFPVGAVSMPTVERFLAWLRATGRVPGARFCTDLEWERAARGADDRIYPHGDVLRPDDANYDLTYKRIDGAYGPDEVGSHQASRSPFGIDDMVGNIMELVTSSQRTGEVVMRGGAYYFSTASCRSTNREPVPRVFRDVTVGVRVCASIAD